MKQINAPKRDWDKKIQIEMSLRELQEILDCVAIASTIEVEDWCRKHGGIFGDLNEILNHNY